MPDSSVSPLQKLAAASEADAEGIPRFGIRITKFVSEKLQGRHNVDIGSGSEEGPYKELQQTTHVTHSFERSLLLWSAVNLCIQQARESQMQRGKYTRVKAKVFLIYYFKDSSLSF